jgi:hypothetical protein
VTNDVRRIRRHWPTTRITLRATLCSGFPATATLDRAEIVADDIRTRRALANELGASVRAFLPRTPKRTNSVTLWIDP